MIAQEDEEEDDEDEETGDMDEEEGTDTTVPQIKLPSYCTVLLAYQKRNWKVRRMMWMRRVKNISKCLQKR